MIDVSGVYRVSVSGDYAIVTVTEKWEQAGIEWVKVDGVFAGSGSETGITFNAASLLTETEYKEKMTPKPFKARFAGKCPTCKGSITVGEDTTWMYGLDVRVKRNPVIHLRCR